MALYRSAQGKMVDMSAIAAKNEKTRAVGNMNVNARGDILDSHNRVITDNTKRVKNNYKNIVGERQPQKIAQPVEKVKPVIQPDTTKEDLSTEELELFNCVSACLT